MKRIAADKNYRMIKIASLVKNARGQQQFGISWEEVVNMANKNKTVSYWANDEGELWMHNGTNSEFTGDSGQVTQAKHSNVEKQNICTYVGSSQKIREERCKNMGKEPAPEESWFETI